MSCFQVFPKLTADIDPTVASLLQTTETVRDEIQYSGELSFTVDKDENITGVVGNWYQLEWAWCKIHVIMQQQSKIHQRAARHHMVRQMSGGQASSKGDYVEPDPSANRRRQMQEQHDYERADIGTSRGLNANYGKKSYRDSGHAELDVDIGGQQRDEKHKADSFTADFSGKEPTRESYNKYREPTKYNSDSDEEDNTSRRKPDDKRPTGLNEKAEPTKFKSDKSMREKRADLEENYGKRISKEILEDDHSDNDAPADLADIGKMRLTVIKNNPNDVKNLDFRYGPLTISVYVGSITLEETDVIVNAAMGSLIHAGGVARAIANKAGPQLERECNEYVRLNGNLPTSHVMHSCAGGAFNSKVKHILHAVGPIYSEGSDPAKVSYILTSTFLNAFLYANDKMYVSSMALPLISSGKFKHT